jgi:hypothetical protein
MKDPERNREKREIDEEQRLLVEDHCIESRRTPWMRDG